MKFGYSGIEITEGALLKIPTIAGLLPEMLDRTLAMCEASGWTVWIGEGARTVEAQRDEFLRRHQVDPNGAISFEGQRWSLKPGMSPLAPPDDRSYHLPTINGRAVAVDLVGDLPWANVNCHHFKLRSFRDVGAPGKREPWHHQLVELPTARSTYNADPGKYPIGSWRPRSLPVTPTPTEEDDMRKFVVVGNDGDRADPHRWLYDGMKLRHLLDPADLIDVLLLWDLNTEVHPQAANVDFGNVTLKADLILANPFWKPSAWITARLAA